MALVSKTVTLKNDDTGATITTTTTNADGEWEFANRDETIRYRADAAFGGSSSQIVVRKPASAEFDHLYANLSFRSAAGATVALGGAVSVGGALTVTGNVTATSGALISRSTSNPRVMLIDTDAGADQKAIGLNNVSGSFGIQPWNDAESGASGDGFYLNRGTGMTFAASIITIGGVQRFVADTAGVNLYGANTITGSLAISTTLGVNGLATLAGGASVTGGVLTVTGESHLSGGLAVTGTLVVDSGQLLLDGPLTVSGDSTFNNPATFNNSLEVRNLDNLAYSLLARESGSGSVPFATMTAAGAVTFGIKSGTGGICTASYVVGTGNQTWGTVPVNTKAYLPIFAADGTPIGYVPLYG